MRTLFLISIIGLLLISGCSASAQTTRYYASSAPANPEDIGAGCVVQQGPQEPSVPVMLQVERDTYAHYLNL